MNTEPLVALIKTTLIDFPGTIASAVFFPGCNMRCPYCHNRELVINGSSGTGDKNTDGLVTLQDVYSHLEKRKKVIKGLVISGGEALLSLYIEPLIQKAKKLGYKIKLDTNGTIPQKLSAVISSPATKPDFISLDIKTRPERYNELTPQLKYEDGQLLGQKLKESAQLLKNAGIPVEFRTVLVPSLVTAADIPSMAALIPPDAPWRFAAFRPGNCLDPLMNNAEPYGPQETAEIIAAARRYIKNAELR